MYCIQTNDLLHQYSSGEVALDRISLHVPEGSVYGFLGPNGAGKTTTLRLLLGLLNKQQGEILFFGKPFHQHRIELLRCIGSLIESPSLYGHLTARENLAVWQKIHQCPLQRIDEVLELAGLSHTGKKRTRHFSLGMKQRLGIAMTMLNNPAVLILDEPTNGLDPQGIIEVREFLKTLNREKKTTILISSHLLTEIDKLATHTGIIHQGRMRFEGTLAELHSGQNRSGAVIIDASSAEKVLQLIDNSRLIDGRIHLEASSKGEIAAVVRLLVTQGIDVYGITTSQNDLESIFMDVLNNN